MKLFNTIKSFFRPPEVDPVAIAAQDLFSASSKACSAAFDAIVAQSTRANHRFTILKAILAREEDPLDTTAAQDYQEVIATYTDPADFSPYNETELNDHSAAIERFTSVFDALTAAFAALKPTANIYSQSAALYKALSDCYSYAADAYAKAAYCAVRTALEDQLRATKDEADFFMSGKEDATLKAKIVENATRAETLREVARIAEAKADVFRAKADKALIYESGE